MKAILKKSLFLILMQFMQFAAVQAGFNMPGAEDTLTKISPSSEFIQFRNDDGSRTLQMRLKYVENKQNKGIKGAMVEFLTGPDLSQSLGKVMTNYKGEAVFKITSLNTLPEDGEGIITLGAVFAGNEQFEPAEEQISVRDLYLKMDLSEMDSIRNVSVRAYEINKEGKEVPLTGTDINFYVPRMFSLFKLNENPVVTDSNGIATLEFPWDLAGDSVGNINVIARIEENETYGNVQADSVILWGKPVFHEVPESFRALWTKVAPTWMVITLIILLLGVWGHYAFAVIQLYRIKKASKKSDA